jgi:hypothetical protein
MKICYVDETGTDGNSPAIVMAGIIADGNRLRRTQLEFAQAFDQLGDIADKAIRELKASDLYGGNRAWRGVEADIRMAVITRLCEWLGERRHDIVLASFDFARFVACPLDRDLDPWMTAALHIALQVQRVHQGLSKNKGATFLVFDENQPHADRLAELLFDPPSWTDEYYDREKTQPRLDQAIDTAFYARSHHVGLVQVADLVAFVLRRYVELNDYGSRARYDGELDRISGWVDLLSPLFVGREHRWRRRGGGDVAAWYTAAAPPSLLALGGREPSTRAAS